MRVCIITSGRRVAPVEQGHPVPAHTYFLAKHLVLQGHEVDMITFPVAQRSPLPYRVHQVGNPRLSTGGRTAYAWNEVAFGLGTALTLRREHRRQPFDLAYFEDRFAAFLCRFLMGAKGFPPSVLWHGGPIPARPVPNPVPHPPTQGSNPTSTPAAQRLLTSVSHATQRWLYRRGVCVVAQSDFLREYLVQTLGARPGSVDVVPASLDADVFSPDVDCTEVRRRWGLEGKRVILCLALVERYKNQMTILRAAPAVLSQVPDAHFLLVGPISSPAYHKELLDYAAAQGIEKHVLFTGMIPYYLDLPPYFALGDVFVLPSYAEGGVPATAIEAMSCGRPAVLSAIPQVRDMLPENSGTILLEPEDAEGLGRSLISLLTNETLRRELGDKARQTVLQRFDWKTTVHQFIEVFQRVSRGRPSPARGRAGLGHE
ncbi:MAG: glycosyltransferase family 4 protein [Chloroflexi bacterium]|nr:glycosyltransferase family 4 protein [Chloroflexota bacterium]